MENQKCTLLYAEPVEGLYYAKAKMDVEKDIAIDFFNILIREYSFSFTKTSIESIMNDTLNMCAVLEKYFIFLNHISSTSEKYKPIIIRTEIEYFFGLIRSLYDLLQDVIKHFVKKYLKQDIKNSFASILDEETNKVKDKYEFLPQKIKEYYESTAPLFFECRNIRDNIYHNGLTSYSIFFFNEGFGIDKNILNLSDFQIWPPEKIKKNDIVSLLALLAYVTKMTIGNMNNLSISLRESFCPPTPIISKNYTVFLRGTCTEHLNKLDEYLQKQWI
jgi:hypothetical protein